MAKILEKLEKINEQMNEFASDIHNIDVSESAEYFKEEYIKRVLSDKTPKFIEENFDYTLRLFDKKEQERIDIIRERMKKGLEDLATESYDDNRFEQEMIFYIEKLDVSEEKMRLSNHLDYFQETMKTNESGKKLGFIGQEIGREINTLGSKSNHAEMQKLVIGMKDNLEKIKEQILNTL